MSKLIELLEETKSKLDEFKKYEGTKAERVIVKFLFEDKARIENVLYETEEFVNNMNMLEDTTFKLKDFLKNMFNNQENEENENDKKDDEGDVQ